MKRELLEYQRKLLYKSKALRDLTMVETNSDEIKKEQDKTYKKWLFTKNLLKAIKEKENE